MPDFFSKLASQSIAEILDTPAGKALKAQETEKVVRANLGKGAAVFLVVFLIGFLIGWSFRS